MYSLGITMTRSSLLLYATSASVDSIETTLDLTRIISIVCAMLYMEKLARNRQVKF